MNVRTSGILLHPSSLPCEYGIGDLGPGAYRFAEFLEKSGQRLWQILPLNPTRSGHGDSPYHSPSAFAGNPLLISPRILVRQGLLDASASTVDRIPPGQVVDFERVRRLKLPLLLQACDRFDTTRSTGYHLFCRMSGWLEDFALHTVLSRHFHPRPWNQWPRPLRERQPDALDRVRTDLAGPIRIEKILQYFFFQQWMALKRTCHRRQIRLIGDMPIYVPFESADVWAHPGLFKLAADGRPAAQSGVPPDYFSATGQLWGHPVYDWRAMQANGYAWWVDRVRHHLKITDVTRIDHFRGLVAYWEVPAGAETAIDGRWMRVPTDELFDRLTKRLGPLPVIAEDLGIIDADVRETIHRYGFPGMQVLLFAFGDDFPNNAFLPHRLRPNGVVYTGTHDNNTVRGWFEDEADAQTKKNLFSYLGREVAPRELPWEMIRLAMMSTAVTSIVPLQDVMGLGANARMNVPSRAEGNWRWRFEWSALTDETAARLRETTRTYGRL
ncbi:MAG: 4-alpha-glucanotransferase [Desulfosarcina sp.]